MSGNIIQYAFVTGELAPKLIGRSDFEKYDLGLALARNWFVDYQGGISTRPGTEFIDFIQHDDQPVREFKFQFSPSVANTYVILFGASYIRFIQNGAYILEADKTVTNITQANPAVVSIAAHSFSNGDWIKLNGVVGMTEINGRTLEVANVTAGTFEVIDPFGNNIDSTGFGAYVSGGLVNRIFTVISPYATADLAALNADQIRDTIRFTHPDYKVRNLTRFDATNWTVTEEVIANDVALPTALAHSVGTAGTAGVIFAVTAVDDTGAESAISDYHFVEDTNDYSANAGFVTLTWTAAADAVSYNIYRSIIISDEAQLTAGMSIGFLGSSFGTQFTDNNIIPDFARTPPENTDPFADGAIESIEVTAQGTAYAKSDTVSVVGAPGVGFRGFPIINDAGEILAVVILNHGSGYVSPVVTFNTSTGSAATATATVGTTSGNNPSVSETFQQRQLYAATDNDPLDIFASKTGLLSNFDVSRNVVGDDAWTFTIDSESITPIRHLLEMRGGLLVFSHTTIWQLRASDGGAITAIDALSEPQSFLGIARLFPLRVDTDILYLQSKDSTVRLLSFNDFSKLYGGSDVSITSSHFFDTKRPIVEWDYAGAPFKIVYAVRADGVMLAFTIVREQNVAGWTWFTTNGKYKNIITVEEDGVDVTYLVVERQINGTTRKYIERIVDRNFPSAEDSWCVDSGLALGTTNPAGTVSASAATGSGVAFTVIAATPFVSGDVGKVLRMGNGKAKITAFVSNVELTGDIVRDIEDINYETDIPFPQESGNWTLDTNVTVIDGFHHLEGETIPLLGDGNVLTPITVVDGRVTLPTGVTRLVGGQGYQCVTRTLPPTASDGVIEGSRKNIIGVSVRIADTRGLKTGQDLDNLFDMKERTNEQWGEPIRLRNDTSYEAQAAKWDDNGQTYLVQDDPLPASILGLVTELDIGDDTR